LTVIVDIALVVQMICCEIRN